jgi:DNA-binding response OmpR family regulator
VNILNYNILVVEDEKNILDVIKAYLEKEGYNVLTASDGERALELFNTMDIHLIILDLMIPKISGEDVCKTIRNTSDVPIIMVTAKTDEEYKIQGLHIGADDYVTKPFSPRELVSRVKALLRRSYKGSKPMAEILSFNNQDLEIDVNKMTVKKMGINTNPTAIEFKVLLALVSNHSQVLSREQLIKLALGSEYEGYDRTIDTHIKNLRQKIEDDPKSPKYILTVYGAGYKFEG